MSGFRHTKQQTSRWEGEVWSVVERIETSLKLRERNVSFQKASQGDTRVRHSRFTSLTRCNMKQQNKTLGTETISDNRVGDSNNRH